VSLRIQGRAIGARVLVDFAGTFALDLHWKAADELAAALRRAGEHARASVPAAGGAVLAASAPADELTLTPITRTTIRTAGGKVFVLIDWRKGFECGGPEAVELCGALKGLARQAEAHDQAEAIIFDHALLTRAGVPIGLSDGMRGEVAKEAAWNRELRRAIPSIESREIFGTPTFQKEKP
jgi:hypothetical protein